MYNYKEIHLGHFDNKEIAIKAYDCAARILFGEYAYENRSIQQHT
jgi:hypothetical protein